ncbi:hypothetical protein PM082_020867 [Marasmius tenuissimus]|nr:hypothetical protein PM082_020867 [Marasmius tenuissimus]
MVARRDSSEDVGVGIYWTLGRAEVLGDRERGGTDEEGFQITPHGITVCEWYSIFQNRVT